MAADPAPLNALFRPDRIAAVTLSPDGLHLAYAVRDGPVASVIVRRVDAPANKVTLFADVGERKRGSDRMTLAAARVLFIGWADATALVYAIATPAANASDEEELHVVDATGGKDRVLLKSDDLETSYLMAIPGGDAPPDPNVGAAGVGADSPAEFPDSVAVPRHMRVIGFDPTRPGTVLVEATGSRFAQTESYRVELSTGKRERMGDAGGMDRLLYDGHGVPRIRETPRVTLPLFTPGGRHSGVRIPPPPPQIQRQRYEYRGTSRFGVWHALNQLVRNASQPGFTVDDSDYYAPRSFPLGFADDPNVLYYASNIGRDTFGIYGLDLTTGKRTAFADENPSIDLAGPGDAMTGEGLVLDRARHLVGVRVPGACVTTHWFDPALARLQQVAEPRFADRSVQFVDWNDAKTRVLMRVWGPGAPARYFIFDDGSAPAFTEVLRAAPPPPVSHAFFRRAQPALPEAAPAKPFTFTTPDGVVLNGVVTIAQQPRLSPAPLVIICPDVPGDPRTRSDFDRTAQVFALSGYTTVKLAYRGTAGFGLRHLDAVKAGYDRVPLEDIHATLAWLASRFPYDHRRVALVGYGFGAYVALRALELYPGEFRAAAAIDPPIDLAGWIDRVDARRGGPRVLPESSGRRRAFFAGKRSEFESISPERGIATLRHPILLMADTYGGQAWADAVRSFRDRLTRQGSEAEYAEIREPAAGSPDPSAMIRVAQFFNANVYDYRVNVGKEHEVK